MNSSDSLSFEVSTRPMPTSVAAAYRNLDLGQLLMSSVFSEAERVSVSEELLDRLISKYGNAEVRHAGGWITIRRRIEQIQRRSKKLVRGPWPVIDRLMKVEEYGGPEEIKTILAAIMQPYWARWWEGFRWDNQRSVRNWIEVACLVLGPRQIRWIAAQHAKVFFQNDDSAINDLCIDAVMAAEAFSSNPSGDRWDKMMYECYRVESIRESGPTSYVLAAVSAAYYASTPEVDQRHGWDTPMFAATRIPSVGELEKLESITKQLITPTLITSPSRGLR